MDDLEQLIKKAKEGDKQAYGAIYNTFYKRIYRYCKVNVYNADLAEDICQETFIKAWRSLGNFTLYKGGSIQAYLFRIARNLIIDHSRKKKEVSLEVIPEIQKEDDLEGAVDRKDDQRKLHLALGKLSNLEKQIVVLKYFEDLSGSEIAKVLSMNEGVLRVRTHRVLKKLKGILEEG